MKGLTCRARGGWSREGFGHLVVKEFTCTCGVGGGSREGLGRLVVKGFTCRVVWSREGLGCLVSVLPCREVYSDCTAVTFRLTSDCI